MTLKSGEDQIKFTHDRHPTHFPIKTDRELDQNPSYVFSMGYDRGGGHELTLSDRHQILESSSMIEIVTFLPRGRRDSSFTIFSVTLANISP